MARMSVLSSVASGAPHLIATSRKPRVVGRQGFLALPQQSSTTRSAASVVAKFLPVHTAKLDTLAQRTQLLDRLRAANTICLFSRRMSASGAVQSIDAHLSSSGESAIRGSAN